MEQSNFKLDLGDYVKRLMSVSFSDIERKYVPASVIELLSRLKKDALSDISDVNQNLFDAQVLIDRSWEYLNTGHWKDVPDSWRLVYAYACFFKIIFLNKNKGDLEEAIKIADKGLLMGIPILDNVLAAVASSINWALSTETQIVGSSSVLDIRNNEPSVKKLKTGNGGMDVQRKVQPSVEWFLTNVMNNQCPFIFTDCVKSWPAFGERRWNIDYLSKIAGNRTVPVEIGSRYTDDSWSQRLITVNEFISKFIEKKENSVGYLAQHRLFDQVPELKSDIRIPEYCLFGEVEPDDIQVNAWIGPEGTVSPLHFDPENNFLVQVVGKKYIRLYSQDQSERLYPFEGMLSNTSQVDILNPDLETYPLFADCPFWECVLDEGEMLFIPPKMWHFVTSLSTSFSVSFWWH